MRVPITSKRRAAELADANRSSGFLPAQGALSAQEVRPSTIIPGLSVAPVAKASFVQQYEAAADVARDLQDWKQAEEEWESGYFSSRRGAEARGAAEEARLFHEGRFTPLREKYAHNPVAAQYLHDEGSRISSAGIERMNAYAQSESSAYVGSVLESEERDLRKLLTTEGHTPQTIGRALSSYLYKAENWRAGRGDSPEDIAGWKSDFISSITSEALLAQYERILQQDPEEATRLMASALGALEKEQDSRPIAKNSVGESNSDEAFIPGEQIGTREQADTFTSKNDSATGHEQADIFSLKKGQTGKSPDAGAPAAGEVDTFSNEGSEEDQIFFKRVSEFSQVFSPEQLKMMHNRAEATERRRRRFSEERAAMVRLDMDTVFSRALYSDDDEPLLSKIEELKELGYKDEAEEIASLRSQVSMVRPLLQELRHEPFMQQRERVTGFFLERGLYGAADGKVSQKILELAEQEITEQERAFINDPAGVAALHPLLADEAPSQGGFLQQHEGVQEYITRSFEVQKYMGQGLGFTPRVLSEAHAMQMKDAYCNYETPDKKASFLCKTAKLTGRYASQCMLEADLPVGIAFLGNILPHLPQSDVSLLVQASGVFYDAPELSPAQQQDLEQRAESSLVVQGLRLAEQVFLSRDLPTTAANDAIRLIYAFIAMGGNPKRLSSQSMKLAASLTPKDMTNILLGEEKSFLLSTLTVQPPSHPLTEPPGGQGGTYLNSSSGTPRAGNTLQSSLEGARHAF